MKLEDKYIFRPYNTIFPKLFDLEKIRLQKILGKDIQIDHIGSTAVSELGGKGVIDISVAAPKNDWDEISKKLKSAEYEYKKKDAESEKERLFFMANILDEELGTRIYHIHLTYPESSELKNEIGFRNYLRTHPQARGEYASIKTNAAQEAQKFKTKDEMRNTYGKIKDSFIQRILKKLK